jgi:hypothetical protein
MRVHIEKARHDRLGDLIPVDYATMAGTWDLQFGGHPTELAVSWRQRRFNRVRLAMIVVKQVPEWPQHLVLTSTRVSALQITMFILPLVYFSMQDTRIQ